MTDGGKGDKQRPLTVPKEQFENNWDAIFKKAIGEHLVKEAKKGTREMKPEYYLFIAGFACGWLLGLLILQC